MAAHHNKQNNIPSTHISQHTPSDKRRVATFSLRCQIHSSPITLGDAASCSHDCAAVRAWDMRQVAVYYYSKSPWCIPTSAERRCCLTFRWPSARARNILAVRWISARQIRRKGRKSPDKFVRHNAVEASLSFIRQICSTRYRQRVL